MYCVRTVTAVTLYTVPFRRLKGKKSFVYVAVRLLCFTCIVLYIIPKLNMFYYITVAWMALDDVERKLQTQLLFYVTTICWFCNFCVKARGEAIDFSNYCLTSSFSEPALEGSDVDLYSSTWSLLTGLIRLQVRDNGLHFQERIW